MGYRRLWRRFAFVALTLVGGRRLAAQTPSERAVIAAWDDSLQHLTAASQLAGYADLAKSGSGPTRNLRRALFQWRSAELRDNRPDIELALDNLAIEEGDHGNWPWAHFAVARACFGMEMEHRPILPSKVSLTLEPYLTAAWRHLAMAMKADSGFQPALRYMTGVLVAGGDRTLRAEELALLRPVIQQPYPSPDLLLVWARYLRALRWYDSSLKVFTRAAIAGADYSVIALERARTLMALKDSAAATGEYWFGLERLTPAGRDFYRFDLSWILSADSLASLDAVPDSGVAGWLHRFWNARDAYSANAPGDRVLEHLRRWSVANTQYRLMEPWNHTQYEHIEWIVPGGGAANWNLDPRNCTPPTSWNLHEALEKQPFHPGDVRWRELLLDHRGIMYLRHGEPLARIGSRAMTDARLPEPLLHLIRTAGRIAPPPPAMVTAARSSGFESWIYYIDGSFRMVSFAGSLWLGNYAATTLKALVPFSYEAFVQRARYIPEFRPAADEMARTRGAGFPLGCSKAAQVAVKKNREDSRLAQHTDSDSPPISDPWASVIRSYALGHAGDSSGKALITFAFGTKDISEDFRSSNGRYEFPVDIRVVAYQASSDRTIAIDTTRYFYSTVKTGWLSGWLEMPLPGGEWQVAVYARQENSKGGAYQVRQGLRIDSAETLSLSDIIVGRYDAPGWRAPDGLLFGVNPVGTWPEKGTADLYFEVRGLTPGASYTTNVQIKATGSKGKAPIDLSTNDLATEQLTTVRKHLGLEQLAPGDYTLTVAVTFNGRRVERSVPFYIAKP